MEYSIKDIKNNHLHLGEIQGATPLQISVTHNNLYKFGIEVLDDNGKILYRPNRFEVKSLPNVPFTSRFMMPVTGKLVIHYFDPIDSEYKVNVELEVK